MQASGAPSLTAPVPTPELHGTIWYNFITISGKLLTDPNPKRYDFRINIYSTSLKRLRRKASNIIIQIENRALKNSSISQIRLNSFLHQNHHGSIVLCNRRAHGTHRGCARGTTSWRTGHLHGAGNQRIDNE